MISQHFQTAIAGLEAERKVETDREIQRIKREEIVPFNADADGKCQAAIAALQQKLNQQIAELQAQFAAQKQQIIETTEQRKNANAEACISAGIASISARYDNAIAELRKLLEKEG